VLFTNVRIIDGTGAQPYAGEVLINADRIARVGRTPHCQNARDLEYFVEYLGMTPMEALLSTTRLGGEIMMMGGELGQLKDGFLADLLLVDGDPSRTWRSSGIPRSCSPS
jgi:predicted amidohydrolase YtcJ